MGRKYRGRLRPDGQLWLRGEGIWQVGSRSRFRACWPGNPLPSQGTRPFSGSFGRRSRHRSITYGEDRAWRAQHQPAEPAKGCQRVGCHAFIRPYSSGAIIESYGRRFGGIIGGILQLGYFKNVYFPIIIKVSSSPVSAPYFFFPENCTFLAPPYKSVENRAGPGATAGPRCAHRRRPPAGSR